jgi:flagellar biosynthetic protein FliP
MFRPIVRAGCAVALVAGLCLAAASSGRADDAAIPPEPRAPAEQAAPAPDGPSVAGLLRGLAGGRAIEAVLPSALLVGVMSLAPAVLLMTTCFVRISVVLGLLRQGLGAAQIPSNQIVASLAIFLSAMVMWPVWTQAWRDGVEPYRQGTLEAAEAFDRGSLPVRRWMATQIEQAGNRDTMLLFLSRHPAGPRQAATYDDVPLETLLPAFLVSELETAFTIGFRMLLPFLVLDILVATLVVSTGLVMLPPSLVSLPLKLLVFVAADGWTLVIRSLLDGVRAAGS